MRRVVVTGMGIISPIGNDINTFWDSLKAGKHGIGPITTFDTTNYKAKMAAEVRGFDAREYMEKADITRSDRYVHLGVAAAVQAVEQSGVIGTVAPERIGVYFGTGIGGISSMTSEHAKLMANGPRRVSPYFVPMMISNMCAGTIAIRYNCMGAALPAVSACASGSNAIGEALRSIRHGYSDVMIAGGSESAINELDVAGFINMQALSTAENPDVASLPFDRRRGGFVMGEGGAALVLEEYGHAVSRGAEIFGEVCGYGSTCDAYHITAPRPDAKGGALAMNEALGEAHYDGKERIYINAHGTGTAMNDVTETLAIKMALGEEQAKKAIISSTKSMTGHLLGAAGAAEAIASILALNNGIIPPTANLIEADPECDLNYTPIKAVEAEVDLALSNSLGFGGHNACLVFRRA